MRKGHNIITTMPWIYLELNGKQLRIDSEDSLNIYSWRDSNIKTPKWVKYKITLTVDEKSGYKKYVFNILKKRYNLSRVIYKAHNPDWDITDTSATNKIDHININSLDNRIENLRVLTNQQNLFNTKAKGYTWSNLHNKWQSQIMIGGKNKHLGLFTEEADARQAYLTAKEKYHKMPI